MLITPPLEIVCDESSVALVDEIPSTSLAPYVTATFPTRSYEPAFVGAVSDVLIAGPVVSRRTVFVVTKAFPARSSTLTASVYKPSAAGSGTVTLAAYATKAED